MPVERSDGRRILYHYLNQSLRGHCDDLELIQDVLSRLISTLGIWFPIGPYKILPIALPHVLRDPTCRPRRRGNSVTKDGWGSPNRDGYIRDDDSLFKGLTRSVEISPASFAPYDKRRLGAGFVAAYVWPRARSGDYSTRNPITNSFWPNLVLRCLACAHRTPTTARRDRTAVVRTVQRCGNWGGWTGRVASPTAGPILPALRLR